MKQLIDNAGTVGDEKTVKLSTQVANDYYHVLMLPQSCKRKDRMEAVGSLFAQMALGEPLTLKSFDSTTTKNEINIRQAESLRAIGMFLGYFFGCSSWRDGKVYDFDAVELNKRVNNIKLLIDNMLPEVAEEISKLKK